MAGCAKIMLRWVLSFAVAQGGRAYLEMFSCHNCLFFIWIVCVYSPLCFQVYQSALAMCEPLVCPETHASAFINSCQSYRKNTECIMMWLQVICLFIITFYLLLLLVYSSMFTTTTYNDDVTTVSSTICRWAHQVLPSFTNSWTLYYQVTSLRVKQQKNCVESNRTEEMETLHSGEAGFVLKSGV